MFGLSDVFVSQSLRVTVIARNRINGVGSLFFRDRILRFGEINGVHSLFFRDRILRFDFGAYFQNYVASNYVYFIYTLKDHLKSAL